MNSNSNNDFEVFCKNKLLQGFNASELKALYDISKPLIIDEGSVLIREGEHGQELFLIVSGSFEVLKYDPNQEKKFVIDTLGPTEALGEISFIDKGFRSASVQAKTECKVRIISFIDLENFVNKSAEFPKLYVHLSKNISQRLRNTNNKALEALKRDVRENKIRVRMGIFLIYIVTGLCLFAYALGGLEYLLKIAPDSSYVTMPLTLVLWIGVLSMMKTSKISWSEFGITTKNWKRSLFEGILFPIPIMGLALFIKWILTLYSPNFVGHPLFEPFAAIEDPHQKNWIYWIGINAIYCFFMVPVQELLTRGALQGLLEEFLTGKYRVFLSILMSNLIFSTVHVYFSLHVGFIVFFGGLFIGWIYSRTHNLIGSYIAHAVLGIWFLSILGAFTVIQKL